MNGEYPEWWDWELSFTAHFDLRSEERDVTELDIRAMLERPKGLERSHIKGRFVSASTPTVDRRCRTKSDRESARCADGLREITMRELQISYRDGRPYAAYLYFAARNGQKSVRTEASADGLLVVDYSADGLPYGVEILAPWAVSRERLNELLSRLGQPPLSHEEYRPLQAA